MESVGPALEVRGLVKRFDDVVAVDGVDLRLDGDELLALVGPSGCGKSTLLRSIAGLLPIDEGTIALGGVLVDDGRHRLPPERRPAGLVFQEHALFPHLSVDDNVGFGLRDGTADDRRARVREMLELVSLPDHGARFPHELSGGERQRVALARALAPRPALMLFDEPFASLDHNLRLKLRHEVVAALKATGTPAVFVTHDQQEALAIGDRVAVMRGGRFRQLGTPADVFHLPVDDFVGSFMGAASFLPIDGAGATASTMLGPIDLRGCAASSVAAMVRPDDIRFVDDPGGGFEVATREYLGSGWIVATRSVRDGFEVLAHRSHLEPPENGDRGRLELVEGHTPVVVERTDG